MNEMTASHADRQTTHVVDDARPTSPAGFNLLDVVGRGGMGVVYRANDLTLGREVAVKILQPRFAPESSAATRFIEEARVTAQLQHPGVPAVYQVGRLDDGRPFLAMKLIKGQTLDVLLKGGGSIDALAVFESISQAVGYAHAHGVIHRDLKPANVMVGAFGEVQVMDWGLSKVVSPSGKGQSANPADPQATLGAMTEIGTVRDSDEQLTQAGSVLGTPAFMAPEQAAGEVERIGVRSDVFGLGAILCAMLTGRPPFEGETIESIRLNAVRGRTQNAFARLDASGADPDVIALCKRCLAFEPADRPADADEVATTVSNLRRAADDRARQAERDKLAADMRRRAFRRGAFIVSGVLMLGIAGTVFGLVRAEGAKRQAQAAEDATLAELREWTDEVGNLIKGRPELRRDEEKSIEKITARWRSFAERRGDDERSQLIRAEGHYRLARLWYALGKHADERRDLEISKSILLPLAAKSSASNRCLSLLATTHLSMGILIGTEGGKAGDSLAEYERARALYEDVIQREPDEPKHVRSLVMVFNQLAIMLRNVDRMPEVLDAYRKAIRLGDRLVEEYPDNVDYRIGSAFPLSNLGEELLLANKVDEALSYLVRARDITAPLVDGSEPPADAMFIGAIARENLAQALESLKRDDDAKAEWTNATEIGRRLAERYPNVPLYRVMFGRVATKFGAFLHRRGDSEAALPLYGRAIDMLTPVLGRIVEVAGGLYEAHAARAAALHDLARYAEAIKDWDRAIELGEPVARYRRLETRYKIEPQKALAEMDELVRTTDATKPDGSYQLARMFARLAKGPNPADPDFAKRAMAMLYKAVAARRDSWKNLEGDESFDSLRGREEFKKLLASLKEDKAAAEK
jgi:tetratricopeptide (TPR) repeat protein